jgi:putative phosphoribosyl transferase
MSREQEVSKRDIRISPLGLHGVLAMPAAPSGLIVFAHGSGSSRSSPRNLEVASALNEAGFATLLFDLLTREEERDRRNVFDIDLLAGRLVATISWIDQDPSLSKLPLGLFGASTGAAAALKAAGRLGDRVSAVVSRGGRPDLASEALPVVSAPTLLIVGGDDHAVLKLNEMALARLKSKKALRVVPGATHLFGEPGALEAVSRYAAEWFANSLRREGARAAMHDAQH